jgi:uncharacterized protein (DUF2249 family)
MTETTVTVDVREDIRAGREPFSKIMTVAANLGEGHAFLLIAPFEPKPIFGVLAKKGFQHRSREVAQGHWEVLFSRLDNGELQTQNSVQANYHSTPMPDEVTSIVEVDARGLEPPQPMVRILETLAVLPNGAEMRAHTNRRPIHLYPHLEERGFVGETKEQNDGSFITHIRRAG